MINWNIHWRGNETMYIEQKMSILCHLCLYRKPLHSVWSRAEQNKQNITCMTDTDINTFFHSFYSCLILLPLPEVNIGFFFFINGILKAWQNDNSAAQFQIILMLQYVPIDLKPINPQTPQNYHTMYDYRCIWAEF